MLSLLLSAIGGLTFQ